MKPRLPNLIKLSNRTNLTNLTNLSDPTGLTDEDKQVARPWRRPALSMAVAGMLLVAGPLVGTASAQDDTTAPSAPEVELLTEDPKAGEPATVRFTSSDPDSGLDGFWYGINAERKQFFAPAPAPPGGTGSAEITFTTSPEGGRMFVYVWSEDIAGNHSDRSVFDFFVPRDPPPPPPVPETTPIASWGLDSDIFDGTLILEDSVGEHHMSLAGVEGTDYDWVDDRFCFPWSALDLSGSPEAFAATGDPVIATDESFSVSAHVLPGEPTGGDQTVLSQSGPTGPAALLQQTAGDGWRFAVPPLSPARPGGVAETAPGSLLPAAWNHLAGVVDWPGREIRLYVNGELAATGELAAPAWPARGPFYVGTAGSLRGTGAPLNGTVDRVRVWSGRLLEDQIEDLAFGSGRPDLC